MTAFRIRPALVFLVTGMVAFPCLAQAPNLRPGLWQYTIQREGAGVVLPPEVSRLPPEQQARIKAAMTSALTGKHNMTVSGCLTADEIKHMSFNPQKDDDKECKSTSRQLSSNTWSMSKHCSRADGAEEDFKGVMHVIDSGRIEQDMTMSMGDGGQQTHQKMHMDGKWVSADCGKEKD